MISENKKICVCFVALKAYPIFNPDVQSVFGGAEVDLYLLSTELAKDLRFNVRFIVGDYGQPEIEVREGVTLFKSLDVWKNLLLQGPRLWKKLSEANADVYMHEACSLGTTLIAFYCKLRKRSFVYRTASSLEAGGECFPRFSLRRFFIQWAFRQADVLIVQNEQDTLNARRTVHREAVMIRNACRVQAANAPQKSGVLWVGRSQPVKRPDLFLQLARAFPDVPFTMVCQQSPDDNDYNSLVKAAEGIANLTFFKRVSFQEVDRYFDGAQISVNTSDSEGFPNTFVQSCKAGTPILSLHVNPDGFLEKYECGFCASGDWDRFVGTLRQWLNSEMPEQLGQNGLNYVKSHHDLTIIIEHYKQIFLPD